MAIASFHGGPMVLLWKFDASIGVVPWCFHGELMGRSCCSHGASMASLCWSHPCGAYNMVLPWSAFTVLVWGFHMVPLG